MPSPRAAMVALVLFPHLAHEHPELVELREALAVNVQPVDHATRLGLRIDAPKVHQSLLDQGSDWSVWDHLPAVGGNHPGQATDLGYAHAILQKHNAFYLGWSRGYGKTLGTAALVEAGDYHSVLVVAPNTAKEDTWARELKVRLPDWHVIIMGNTPVKRARALALAQAYDEGNIRFVLVAHHESLSIIAGKGARKGTGHVPILDGWSRLGVTWDLFAMDEGHRLAAGKVKRGTQLSRAAGKVPSRRRLLLSGSVFQNSWEELYGPLHWLFPERYRSKWNDWNLRFLDYVEGYGRICVGIQPGAEQTMADELGVFMVVREKPDLTTHRTVLVDLSPEQRRVYDDLRDLFIAQLDSGELVVTQNGIAALTRLRQVATGLELLSGKVADSSKLDAAVELITTGSGVDDDFFVACWYKASAYALAERLLRERPEAHVVVITGDVPMKQRTELLAQAREVAGEGAVQVVLIGTIPTLGESVNLQFLNHVLRLDRSWNPAMNRQVVDRVDRQGQTRMVTRTDIVARDTVDELVVLPNLANKDALRAQVLGRAA